MQVKMKAATIAAGKKDSLKVESVKMPKIGNNEVLIKVNIAGLDNQDYEITKGLKGQPDGRSKKLIIGHECVGQVIMVGEKVEGFKDGDLVVPTIRRPGTCTNCQKGEYDMCIQGDYKERGIQGLDGVLSEYIKENPDYLVKVSKKLKDCAVLLPELSIVEKAYRTIFALQSRMVWKPKRALVVGANSLGMLSAALLKQKGFDTFAAYEEADDIAIALFNLIGVKHFKMDGKNLHDTSKKSSGAFDTVFDTTGSKSNVMHASSLLTRNGVYAIIGALNDKEKVRACSKCSSAGIINNNSTIVSVESSSISDYKEGIKDMGIIQKLWPELLDRMITPKYSIDNVSKAVKKIQSSLKTVIVFE